MSFPIVPYPEKHDLFPAQTISRRFFTQLFWNVAVAPMQGDLAHRAEQGVIQLPWGCLGLLKGRALQAVHTFLHLGHPLWHCQPGMWLCMCVANLLGPFQCSIHFALAKCESIGPDLCALSWKEIIHIVPR